MKALKEVGFRKALRFGLYTLFLIPLRWLIFPQLRVPYLRLLGARIGRGVIIHEIRFFNTYRTGFRGLEIGDHCFIGDEALIDLAERVIMADHDIQKSKQLLKRLEEEMIFLSSLMYQAQIVASNLKETWTAIDQINLNWKRDIAES